MGRAVGVRACTGCFLLVHVWLCMCGCACVFVHVGCVLDWSGWGWFGGLGVGFCWGLVGGCVLLGVRKV